MSDLRLRIEKAVFNGGAKLPRVVKRAIAGKPPTADGRTLDVDFAVGLRMLEFGGATEYAGMTLQEARELLEHESLVSAGQQVEVRQVEDLTLDLPDASIPARLYKPSEDPKLPLLVYFHGGGWVLGSFESHDGLCRRICDQAQVAVLNVGYRLAPEHRFPAAVDDAIGAFRWAVEHASEIGVDPRRIAVGGDSAGGNLSAVIAQQTRGDAVQPAFQLLFVPVTDLSRRTDSYAKFREGYFLTASEMDWYQDHYIGPDGDAADPRVSPLLAQDLTDLPPAYVGVAGFDVLRDEGIAYAEAMQAAGDQVQLRVVAGGVHPWVNSPLARTSREHLAEALGALRQALGVVST